MHVCVCVCRSVCERGSSNVVNKTARQATQNRKTTDNEQIQLKVGQCNELFIAQRRAGHEKGGCEGGINCERGGGRERGREGGKEVGSEGRWWKR